MVVVFDQGESMCAAPPRIIEASITNSGQQPL